ncbi:hypothetical protein L226DRAFT_15809 [Lentinus tigrinus ALCF2SS1-7]|uniref:uncharacterized protein n=1 Tax=Lentinus tigrinus ALCF2SS1-7 TaxID=1328758 RepID=UPI0011660DB6|nr:hypothetical protein L226DRAFT_15809 [Lentinus tigrinus ALCF2SS1-7]
MDHDMDSSTRLSGCVVTCVCNLRSRVQRNLEPRQVLTCSPRLHIYCSLYLVLIAAHTGDHLRRDTRRCSGSPSLPLVYHRRIPQKVTKNNTSHGLFNSRTYSRMHMAILYSIFMPVCGIAPPSWKTEQLETSTGETPPRQKFTRAPVLCTAQYWPPTSRARALADVAGSPQTAHLGLIQKRT